MLIAGVNQEFSPSIDKSGLVKLEKALKIVNITTILTKLVVTKSRDPEKGRYAVIRYRPKAIGISPKGLLSDSTISSSKVVSEPSASFAI